MLKFPVSVAQQTELLTRMRSLHVCERDIKETYSKPCAVNLTHIPSGIRVRSAREHTQGLNRYHVRQLLLEELEARAHGKTRHVVRAAKLREEKERRDHKKAAHNSHSPMKAAKKFGRKLIDHLSSTHLFDAHGEAMSAYFLRPLP